MRFKKYFVIVFSSFLSHISFANHTPYTNLIHLSQQFLQASLTNQDRLHWQTLLCNIPLDEVKSQLTSDDAKKCFWINIYNGFIQFRLREKPELYSDKSHFFDENDICIFDHKFSFNFIEHSILRRSQNRYGFGYISKWFPSKLEKELRLSKKDYRIHFVLNCGAKSCPPIRIVELESIDYILDQSEKHFIRISSEQLPNSDLVTISPLFLWFKGDFGGDKGIKNILNKSLIFPFEIQQWNYSQYDWKLDLDNLLIN